MKRSEMVKKLSDYIDQDETDVYPDKILQFLEDQGMMYHYPWDPEEDPIPLGVEEQILEIIRSSMGWTPTHAYNWYRQLNPLLGGLSPSNMVYQGKQDKLMQWINNQIGENEYSPHMQDQLDALSSMTIVEPDEFVFVTEPKLPQKDAVKRLRLRYNARRQSIKPSKELRKALKGKKKYGL